MNRVRIRPADPADIPALLSLQEANLRDNLPASERGDGFVTTRLSGAQLGTLLADGGATLAVADADDALLGYASQVRGVSMNRGRSLRSWKRDSPVRHGAA